MNTNIQKTDRIHLIIDKLNLQAEEILSCDYDQAQAKLGVPVSQRNF